MLADRSLLRLSGDDVRGFLQGLVTADMAGPFPVWAGLLTPQGKALFDFIIWSDGDDILLDCEASAAEGLKRRLSIYRLRRAITIEVEGGLAVHWSVETPARPVSDDVVENGASTRPIASDPRLRELGYRWLAPPADAANGWLAHRLSLGVTEGVAELGSDKTLWLECNARELNGVSFTKGCYVGQENTARMHHRSKVNRRLIVAPLTEPTDRTRATYPELGLMVEHRRVEALGNAIAPDWLSAALKD